MPSRALHVAQARRNLATIDHLLTSDADGARQWAVIAAFYCGLHCVEAHFADDGQHQSNHRQRQEAMAAAGDRIPVNVFAAYALLEHRANAARYGMQLYSRDEVDRIVREYLTPLRRLAGLA